MLSIFHGVVMKYQEQIYPLLPHKHGTKLLTRIWELYGEWIPTHLKIVFTSYTVYLCTQRFHGTSPASCTLNLYPCFVWYTSFFEQYIFMVHHFRHVPPICNDLVCPKFVYTTFSWYIIYVMYPNSIDLFCFVYLILLHNKFSWYITNVMYPKFVSILYAPNFCTLHFHGT